MRGKTKIVSVALCAVLMLGFALTANAAVNWNVSSNPNQVTQYGVTELMGRVRLQVAANGTTVGSTITITYQGVTIKNTAATGITIGGTLPPGTAAIAQVVPTTGTGGQVILAIADAIAVTGGTAELTVDGVRADVSALPLATDVQASLSSTSSTANTFVNVSVVRVATVNKSLDIVPTARSSAFCLDPVNPSLTVNEGFSGAFAQYVTSVSGIAPSVSNVLGARVRYGANRNIRIHIVVSTLPVDVTLDWPDTVNATAGPGTLQLISQSSDGTDALYEFVTPNQALSDQLQEAFVVTPALDYDPDTAEPGSSTVQARLEPQDATLSTEVPRFIHPYIPSPPANFLSANKCTTNLLFTFLTNATGVGFDSGIAIANTSQDPYGTAPQHGTITLYFYGTNVPAPLTTPDVVAGATWANSLSTIAPGFQGYVIAVAQFQYGHGYAFITGKYNAGSVYDVAEGYVGIVIPDPTFTPLLGVAHRYAGPPPQNNITLPPSSGEQLGQ
jgi:hypothetical protein